MMEFCPNHEEINAQAVLIWNILLPYIKINVFFIVVARVGFQDPSPEAAT